jgi:hypothetical protein
VNEFVDLYAMKSISNFKTKLTNQILFASVLLLLMFDQFLPLTGKKNVSIFLKNQFELLTARDFVILRSPFGVHIEIVPSFERINNE